MDGITALKATARKAAFARRKQAKSVESNELAVTHLRSFLAAHTGKTIAGYMPIQTEIDPLPVMAEWAAIGDVGVPVILGAGQPLAFHRWTPETEMIVGAFGAMIPATAQLITPDVLIVPLVAFDTAGGRLGYGGGYYDRTLEKLRAKQPTIAVGFAFAGQQAENLPSEATDQPLDAMVTENGILTFQR